MKHFKGIANRSIAGALGVGGARGIVVNNVKGMTDRRVVLCIVSIFLLLGSGLVTVTPIRAADGYYRIDASGGDCTLIGTWDHLAKTCTLSGDTDLVVLLQEADGVTLDGAGYQVVNAALGVGTVAVVQSSGTVTVKNVQTNALHSLINERVVFVNNIVHAASAEGIYVSATLEHVISGNQILNAPEKAIIIDGNSGAVTNNVITNPGWTALSLYNVGTILIEGNTIIGEPARTVEIIEQQGSVRFSHNNVLEETSEIFKVNAAPLVVGNYWLSYDEAAEGCLDANTDGVCDGPLGGAIWDQAPFTRRDAWLPPTVDAGGPYSVVEGDSVNLSASGSDPSNDPLSYAWDLDGDGVYETAGQSVVFDANAGPGVFPVAVEVSDPYGDTATDTTTVEVEPAGDTQPPVVSDITIAPNPAPVGEPATITVQIDDSTTGGSAISQAFIELWSDSLGKVALGWMAPSDGAWDEAGETAVLTVPDWLEAGLYDVHVYGVDSAGNQSAWAYGGLLVMYDPNDGFVTGHARFMSPAGAYAPDPNLSGEAILGFVSKYRKGATVPSGHTSFEFETAGLSFYSDTYEWLVVAPPYRATFRGVGALNGEPGCRFTVWAIDGDLDGTGVDKVRIRIWDDDGLVYDNEIDNGLQDDPVTAILTGNVMIHRP